MPAADRPASSTAAASVQPAAIQRATFAPKRTLVTRPIQDIRVGQRVLAENPELRGEHVPQLTIDPENTRLVVLHQIKPDGYELTVETLFPLESLLEAAIEFPGSGTGDAILRRPMAGVDEGLFLNESLVGLLLDLDIAELGIEGSAEIVAVHSCPPIEPDDGTGRRLVTSVFRHSAANVVDVSTTASHESIGATGNHPFWSEDRHEFVPASELRPGENLRSADGTLVQVTRITPRRGPPVPVFNFEVDGQHVYSVGADGLLVHNGCVRKPSGSYTINFANGMQYHGKGPFMRALTSAARIAKDYTVKVRSIDWSSAKNTARAFIDEALRIRDAGGIGLESGNYNMRNSPGEKVLKAMAVKGMRR